MDCLNLSHKLAYEYEIKPRQEAFFLVGSLYLYNSSGMFAFFSLVSPHFQRELFKWKRSKTRLVFAV